MNPSIPISAREVRRGEPDYPARLDEALGEKAPPSLWIRGQVPAGRCVAVVGARKALAERLVTARDVALGLSQSGITVVSGGALGVDGAAHMAAVEAQGHTVVVLGTGIDVPYPREHEPLFNWAVEGGGALISQFLRDQQPTKWAFPARNELIAALADTTIVVEAGRGSGALYTAEAAIRMGKRLVAVRGSAGCDALADRGALMAGDADEVLAHVLGDALENPRLPSVKRTPSPPPQLELVLPVDPRALRLYQALDRTPRDLSDLAARAGLPAGEAMALAIDLELEGLATRAAGGRYRTP